MSVRLSDLQPGQSARVQGFDGGPPPARLLEMGLLPGTEVSVVRLAPFGDPIDLRCRGFHLSLRKSEASQILVERT